jgi:molybdenum cofactor guanylyltransferase
MTHVLESLAPLELPTVIVTNTPDEYVHYGLSMIADFVGQQGALGGLYTALRSSSTEYVLCAACDMPFLSLPLLRSLIEQRTGYDGAAAMLDDVWQVFPGVYSQRCLPTFEHCLETGALRLQGVLNRLNMAVVQTDELRTFDDTLRTFTNINTRAELAQFDQTASSNPDAQ